MNSMEATTLSSSDLRAHNSFDAPNALAPRTAAAASRAGGLVYVFAAASVTRLQFALE